ncbi:hypothetical protein KP509_04G041400 [Ceratopteris richardii]|uniref:Uncharacterized protein n=1 Tax=Ceratopteris richardii TaxID=49495 RepID=A0A8T2UZQ7_CERRI|nr:hypothetical protein KP509_04G041400 [Ceratopteris richardii]
METFEAIFGQAEGSLEEAIPCALLPFVFLLHSSDGKSLRFHVSDFHSNTWQTIRTHELLEDLRDQVGIGGTWDDFIQYIRDAFLSENVKLILGGPASSIGGHGATTARVVAQKSRGMPRISLNLEKLTGSPAEDVMGLIMVELLKSYRHKSNALQIGFCVWMMMLLVEETKTLQEQVDAAFHRGKRRGRVGASQFSTEITDAPLSQFDSKVGDTQTTFATQSENNKPKTSGRVVPLRNKVHLAHAKRAKQRGARLAVAEDE